MTLADEVAIDVSLEFLEEGIKISAKEVKEIAKNAMKISKKLIRVRKADGKGRTVNRIFIPGFGEFRYSEARERAQMNRTLIMPKEELTNEAYERLKEIGWGLLRWTRRDGYSFYNEFTGQVRSIRNNGVKGKKDANLMFYYVLLSEKNRKPLTAEKERYDKWKKEFKGNVILYMEDKDSFEDKEHVDFIGSVEEVSKKYMLVEEDVYRSVYYNKKKEDTSYGKMAGKYIAIDELDKGKSGITLRHHSTKYKKVHKYLVDIYDKDTNELLYKEYGTPRETIYLLKYLGKTNNPDAPVAHLVRTGKPMYGLKFKKSNEE